MFKFEQIKDFLKTNQVDLNSSKWVVISWFDKEWKVLFVKWLIFTDENLESNLKKLFDKFILPNKRLKTLIIDIVDDIEEIKDISKVLKLNLKENWIFIWDVKNADIWAFILPDTKWISDFKQAYKIIKNKVNFSSSAVNLYTFKSKRLVLES